jgi:hypothetical protein
MYDKMSWPGRSITLDTAYEIPYDIKSIEGQNLVFIPKFEVGGKVIVSDKSDRRGRPRKLEAA